MTDRRGPQSLTPELDRDTPDGVEMWVLEGAALPPGAPLATARFTVAPGAATSVDVHDVVEVWTVTAGEGVLLSGGDRRALRTGESVYFPGRLEHQLVNDSDRPVEVVSLWWSEADR